ncbi:MAG: MFS transporter [Ignavibacteriales bacterium]|nr:MFS transporter [Ignavibacteriales bacterium]
MNTRRSVTSTNFRYHLIEGALYFSSFALLNFQVVFPALVQRLGGSNIAIGSLPMMNYLCYLLPQVISANYVMMEPYRKPWVIISAIAQRSMIFLMAVVIALFGGTLPSLALLLFFLLFILNQTVAGIAAPNWYDFVVKTTHPLQRGRLMGMRSASGALLGFFNSLILATLLTYLSFPMNYALAFFLAFGFQFASLMIQRNIVEDIPSPTERPVPLSRLAAKVIETVKSDAAFRRFLLAVGFSVIGLMPQGFFTVAAFKRFDLPDSFVGFFTMTMLASQVIFAGVLGWIADLRGHRVSLVVCAAAMAAASILALVANHPAWFFIIFSFVGLIFGVELITRHNFVSDMASNQSRPLYIGIMNAWSAPFFLSSLIGGWISDQFGYNVVFILGAVFSLVGLFILTRVPDPRARKRMMHPATR